MIIVQLIILFIIVCSLIIYYKSKVYDKELIIRKKDSEIKTLTNQKKSSEIITGQITEKIVPFMDVFKYSPRDAVFCGNPIDYIVFDKDHIAVIEIKTGNAKLTKKQQHIKKLVEDKKIIFKEVRIK